MPPDWLLAVLQQLSLGTVVPIWALACLLQPPVHITCSERLIVYSIGHKQMYEHIRTYLAMSLRKRQLDVSLVTSEITERYCSLKSGGRTCKNAARCRTTPTLTYKISLYHDSSRKGNKKVPKEEGAPRRDPSKTSQKWAIDLLQLFLLQ